MTATPPPPREAQHDPILVTAQVPLDHIWVGDDTLRDQPLDEDHVTLLANVFDNCPLVVVQQDTLRLIDGRHRLEAARRLGHTHITVELADIDHDRLTAERIRRNTTHGLPLTQAERRRAVDELLKQHPDWSDRRIARCAGTAHTTVGRVRRGRDCPGGATLHPTGTHRVGEDGKTYPAGDQLATAHQRVCALLEDHPTRSDRSIARATGLAPSTVGRLREHTSTSGQQQPAFQRAVTWLKALLTWLVRSAKRPTPESGAK